VEIYIFRFRNVLACLLAILVLSGCVAYEGAFSMPYQYPHTGSHYNIPPGHMPPPGECRIWFPGLPPGQQPPPGNCYDLERRVPSGAFL